MECRRLQESEHAIVHCRTRQLHEIIDKRIAAPPVGMQEATR
jgi:hypothetical protein